MYFERVYEPGLAHASYVVGCQATGTALVLDPKRDVDTYLEIARREGLQITFVAETHIHADFLSGARELSELTGAELLLSDEGGPDWQYAFEHVGLRHGQIFRVGNLEFKVLHTPGHTPEHIMFLLSDRAASSEPLLALTGDFVFVGDVGRPDLLEKAAGLKGTQELGARQMWESLEVFRALPDFVQVWPAHGAGSACGKALGSVPSSTVGYEKRVSWAFRREREAFQSELLFGQPEPPRYFGMMKKLNKEKRKLVPTLPRLQELDLTRFDIAVSDGAALLDVRDRRAFATAHIPGSINIPLSKSLSTWAGWLLDYDKDIVLIAALTDVERAQRALLRIGFDRIVGYLPDVGLWREKGRKTGQLQKVLPAEVPALVADQQALVIDVRAQTEHEEAHIPGALNIHCGLLRDRAGEVPRDRPVILHCQSGGRSAIATSVLKSLGYESVFNLEGGIEGWGQHGLPVERSAQSGTGSD
jgi:hydroxyacylglutathione hydrolase